MTDIFDLIRATPDETERFRIALRAYANDSNWVYGNQWVGPGDWSDLAQFALNPPPEPLSREEIEAENARLKARVRELEAELRLQ